MTIAEPIQHQPPDPDQVTLDKVVETFEQAIDRDASEIMQCMAALNGSLQYSRQNYYLPQEVTDPAVARVIGDLLGQGRLADYLLSMLSGLLLNRSKREQHLQFYDWTAFREEPCIAFIIKLAEA